MTAVQRVNRAAHCAPKAKGQALAGAVMASQQQYSADAA